MRLDSGKYAGPAAWAAALFVLAFALYANTLRHEFVWDDVRLIEDNPRVRQLDADGVKDAFATHYLVAVQPRGSLYRPLSTVSFQIDHAVHAGDAGGFHLTNVFLNAIHCVLVFLFVLVLFRSLALAAAAGLLYTVLPLHTENVAWVAGRTDLLSAVWMTTTLILYVAHRRRPHLLYLLAGQVAFLAGLLSKEITLALLPLMVLFEVTPIRRLLQNNPDTPAPRSLVFGTIGTYGVTAIVYLILRHKVIGGFNPVYTSPVQGIGETVALAVKTVGGYTTKILFPFVLNAEYEIPLTGGAATAYFVLGLATVAGLLCLLWRWRHRGFFVAGLAIYAVTLLPVLNVIPIAETAAERFLYYPTVGSSLILAGLFAPALTAVVARRQDRRPGRGMWIQIAGFVILVVACAVTTVGRNAVWRSEDTLFATTVRDAGDNARAHLNLGNTYYKKGNYIEAIAEYEKALALDPGYAGAWSSQAGAYLHLGQPDRALRMIDRALEIESNNANFLGSRGTILSRLGRYDEAATAFESALRVRPDHGDAMFNYALSEYRRGDFRKSKTLFERVPRKDTDYIRTWYYLGAVEARLGNRQVSRQHLNRFLSLYPHDDAVSETARELLK
jgi:tetratricopeptide (TPR) repeat protein